MAGGNQFDRILSILKGDNAKTVTLVGQPGVGKTWMARELSNRATEKGSFDFTLWLFLNREYDRMALCKSFAQQLYLLPTDEECEDDDSEEEEVDKEETEQDLREKISAAVARKKFLIILDDEGKKMNEEQIMFELETLLNLNDQSSYKVLITTTNYADRKFSGETRAVIEVKPLSVNESSSLLEERAGTVISELPESLVDAYVKISMGLPAAIVVMAKALGYFGSSYSGVQKLEIVLEEATDRECFDIALLLRYGYDKVPSGVLIDCCWPNNHFFRDSGAIHYNELIAYWIMEGYLGQVDCIEKAYEEGYRVLMELIDFRLLKTVETDFVVMTRATVDLDDCNSCGFGGTASLGLANVFRYGEWQGLGRITQVDGFARSFCSGKRERKLSTLLLDGNHIGREIPSYLLQSQEHLQVLTVLKTTLESLRQPLSKIGKLNVLVLRGCHLLDNIENIIEFRRLTVLEISGPISLDMIPDDFFRRMPYLRSLNLSALLIESLPSSLYDLSELNWLILRDCSQLKTIRSLRRLRNLAVLDLSGALSLENIQDKNFLQNQELQMLNFSKAKMKNFPSLNGLGKLTHLLLRGCQELNVMCGINFATSLQVIDFSESRSFEGFFEQSLESIVDLKILDLSGTAIRQLPSNIGNPLRLYLKDCTQLEAVQSIETLTDLEALDISKAHFKTLPPLSHLCNLCQLSVRSCLNLKELPSLNSLKQLEVLDLSGCTALKVIQDKSFEQMSRLQRLDLSETRVQCLPSLLNLSHLRHLLLKKCTHLIAIPPLDHLSNLEELNLCGISCLHEYTADFLKNMSHLQILDLSETQLKQLPSMSKLRNLHELYVRGCLGLKEVPNLEALTKLEVLDLSGTAVSHLPSLANFSNLRQLLLRDCSGLEEFLLVEMLDVLGATVKEFPYGISELTHLERLDLPNLGIFQEDLYLYNWGISSFQAEIVWDSKRPIPVISAQFLRFLEKNRSLWDTSFKEFHFSICPTDDQNKKPVQGFHGDDFIFKELYFQSKHCTDFKEQRLLEICGFSHFPKGTDEILSHADYVFFIDNTFKTCMSGLVASNVMKGCWIERCTEMERIFQAEEVRQIENLGSTLEILSVSNALNLKNICGENLQFDVFQNLNSLYLDCCPKLSTVFSSSQPPKNLKVLHIKFCDILETLFEQSSQEPELRNLKILHLWVLPEFKSIGCALPALETLKIWECPKLQNFEEIVKYYEVLETLDSRLW